MRLTPSSQLPALHRHIRFTMSFGSPVPHPDSGTSPSSAGGLADEHHAVQHQALDPAHHVEVDLFEAGQHQHPVRHAVRAARGARPRPKGGSGSRPSNICPSRNRGPGRSPSSFRKTHVGDVIAVAIERIGDEQPLLEQVRTAADIPHETPGLLPPRHVGVEDA